MRPATIQDGRLLVEILNQSFGHWILEAGNTRVADPVDDVYHKMDSIVHSHCVDKSVVTSNRITTCLREGACQPIQKRNFHDMTVIKYSQIVGHTLSEIYSQITWHYIILHKGLCRLLFGVCHITGRRKKGKGLKVPCKYNYYCGPTKTRHLFLL